MKNHKKQNALVVLFRNLALRIKLLMGFGVLLLMLIIIAISAYLSIGHITYQDVIMEKIDEGTLNFALARLEQVRYEADVDTEQVAKVNDYLDTSKQVVEEARGLMLSDSNRSYADHFLESIEVFRQAFQDYVSIEEEKEVQINIRIESDQAVVSSFTDVMTLESDYMDGLKDLEALSLAREHSDILHSASSQYLLGVRSALIYDMKQTEADLGDAHSYMDDAQTMIVGLKDVVNSREVLDELEIIEGAIVNYKEAMSTYEGLLASQASRRSVMRDKAQEAQKTSMVISEGVLAYLTQTEKTANMSNLILIVLGLILSILMSMIMTTSVVGPLKKAITSIQNLANYQLNKPIDSELALRKDEIGLLAKSVVAIEESQYEMVTHLRDSSSQLRDRSEHLWSITEITSTTSEEIAMTISDIANGAVSQAENTEAGAHAVDALGETIDQENQLILSLSQSADVVDKYKVEGVEAMNQLVQETNKSSESTLAVQDIVLETNNQALKIDQASQMIQSITKQTNLLALNASIEAARAGEQGKGFAVVAEEIRQLAEQSRTFTEEIVKTIKSLLDKSSMAVDYMEASIAVNERQKDQVSITYQQFSGIDASVDTMRQHIKDIQTSSVEMESKKNHMIDIIGNLSALAEENAAGTEEVTASVEEQTASIQQVLETSQVLKDMSLTLDQMVHRFQL